MTYGYHGKILRVDLTEKRIWVEKQDESFFRFYMGGGALGAHYVCKNVRPGTHAFAPENIMVFCGSVITGAPVAGFSRHSVTGISPLTGGIADSEAGGYWGRALKEAGFDAVVIEGRSPEPVYLLIDDGDVEIKDAGHIWGRDTGETQDMIWRENDDEKIRVLGIGPAGENEVYFACIVSELKHFHGRGGHGAVMGSKNLKAIAVKGDKFPPLADQEKVQEIARNFAGRYMDFDYTRVLREIGTSAGISFQNYSGQLPTHNWQTGCFPGAQEISGETMMEEIGEDKGGCFACPVRCKVSVKASKPYPISKRYGGPEYESLASLGSYTGVSNLYAVAKANELCNRYGLDTISTGGVIAFAMDCYENGLLTDEDTGGLELKFGSGRVLLDLIEMIARQEGIGHLLAQGTKKAAESIGGEAKKLAVHCKGLEFPAHEPRVKKSLALAYGTAPIGADHMASEHDFSNTPETPAPIVQRLWPLGISKPLSAQDLGPAKVKFFYYTHILYSVFNSLDTCIFCMAPLKPLGLQELVDAVRAVTGWDMSLWELMKVGERRLQMMRVFNCLAGLDESQDALPPRMFEPLQGGETHGMAISPEEYEKALKLYYDMAGWDSEGIPRYSKLVELDLEWVEGLKERSG